MSNAEAGGKLPRNVSYLRTKDPLEAVAVKAAISQFFGPVQEPPATAQRPPKVRHEPKHAMWIIGGGTALVIAAVMSVAFRDQLPAAVPGFYLGLGGLAVILAGILYARFGAVEIDPPLTEEKKTANKARDEIDNQIKHFKTYADGIFGPPPKGAKDGTRAHLVGIGRKEWNGQHEVPIVEVKGDQILAAVVHLVSINLTPTNIAIKQLGLHLMTGTVYNESTSTYLLTDVLSALHEEKKLVATNAWDRAAALAKEIELLQKKANKSYEKDQADIEKLKKQLNSLTFEEPAGNKFMISFANGDKLEIIIADSDHPNNRGDIGYPIGGRENLESAIAMWDAINKSREMAKVAQHSAVTGVKDGLDDYQKTMVNGLQGLQGQLASLEGVMKEVLAVLKAGPPLPPAGGGVPVVILTKPNEATATAYTNGQSTSVAAPAPDPATSPAAQPIPEKVGA